MDEFTLNPIDKRCRRPEPQAIAILLIWTASFHLGGQLIFGLFWLFGQRIRKKAQYVSRYYSWLIGNASLKSSLKLKYHRKIPPLPKQFILIFNHLGPMDIIYVGSSNPRSIIYGKYASKFHPLFGPPGIMNGYVFANKPSSKNSSSNLENIMKVLKDGESITIFPEGATNKVDGEVKEFKNGVFVCAFETKVPIVAVSICDIPGSDGKNHIYLDYQETIEPADFLSIEELRNNAREVIAQGVLKRHRKFHEDGRLHKDEEKNR